MLELQSVTARVGSKLLFENLSLSLEPGRVHVLIGPNGAGKSSLLKVLFGELGHSGQIRMQGDELQTRHLPRWRKRIGYMPQDTALELGLTALEVVLLGRLDALGMHLGDDLLMTALRALDAVGMAAFSDRPVRELSGGQRQMVLFAQVLLREPLLMMLDEPVSALDLQHQVALMDHLWQQTRRHGWITLVVLHDLNLAAQYADQLIVLADGALQACGAPADVLDEALIRRLYKVPVSVQRGDDGVPHIRIVRTPQENRENCP